MSAHDVVTNNGTSDVTTHWFHRREPLTSLFLVLFAVAFNLYHLYPEVAGDVLV